MSARDVLSLFVLGAVCALVGRHCDRAVRVNLLLVFVVAVALVALR